MSNLKCLKCFPVILLTLVLPAVAQREEVKNATRTEIAGWVDDLSHPDLARRETATRELIRAGEAGARAVRALCTTSDGALALRARRVFGAVHGVDVETYAEVIKVLTRARARSLGADAARRAIAEHGPAAERLALRLLDPKVLGDRAVRAEILVRHELERLAGDEDRGDRAYASITALGSSAEPALSRVLRNPNAPRSERAHALWLYALVTGANRAGVLASIAVDRDPVLRREAALALAETLRDRDFYLLASSLGTRPGVERELLANAASRRLSVKQLRSHLSSRDTKVAALAAVVLGLKKGDEALTALTARTKEESRSEVREAMATALREFSDSKALEALGELYVRARYASVRSTVLSSLRHHASEPRARLVLLAGLLDGDEAVRMTAADALAGASDKSLAPALIRAALGDRSEAVRARALAGLEILVPEGPRAGRVAARPLEAAVRSWRSWLKSNRDRFESKELPWFKAANEARALFTDVRSHVERTFFHFGKKELVERKNLDKAAFNAVKQLVAKKDGLKMVDDFERHLLERLVRDGISMEPEAFLGCLGAIPFRSKVSELIRITNAASSGLVRSLGDRYSRLILSNDPEGKLRPDWVPGLLDDANKTNGFIVQKKKGGASSSSSSYVVDFVLFDSPAYDAGLRAGDQLVKIDQKFTTELTEEEVVEKVKKEGEFFILRPGWNRPYGFRMKPAEAVDRHLVLKAVLPGKIGYIRLRSFDAGSSVKLERALHKLERQGIVGLILDLRNNPGGTVADATAIVDKFLPAGKLITTMERQGAKEPEEIKATDAESDRVYPLAVLVNRSSASASEMTSGSLQGNGRAIILGETTFGKGIGQSGRIFSGFSRETALGETRSIYAVYLTMMRYYVPEGKRSIHKVGVEPDVTVRERQLRGSLFDKVMRVRRGKALDHYVTALLKDQPEKCLALARRDDHDTSRYPGFEEFMKKIKNRVSGKEATRIVRAEIRRRLEDRAREDADLERFESLVCDVQEDRVLLAAMQEIAKRVGGEAASSKAGGKTRQVLND